MGASTSITTLYTPGDEAAENVGENAAFEDLGPKLFSQGLILPQSLRRHTYSFLEPPAMNHFLYCCRVFSFGELLSEDRESLKKVRVRWEQVEEKKKEIFRRRDMYYDALGVMSSYSSIVAELCEEMTQLSPHMVKVSKERDEIMSFITNAKRDAENQTGEELKATETLLVKLADAYKNQEDVFVDLQNHFEQASSKLHLIEQLMRVLGGERHRWCCVIQQLDVDIDQLHQQQLNLLASGIFEPTTENYRRNNKPSQEKGESELLLARHLELEDRIMHTLKTMDGSEINADCIETIASLIDEAKVLSMQIDARAVVKESNEKGEE